MPGPLLLCTVRLGRQYAMAIVPTCWPEEEALLILR